MTISLRHRAAWVVLGGAVGLVLAALLGLSVAELIVLTVLGAVAVALAVAVNSYLRHSADPEAQPEDGYPVAANSRNGNPPR
ncbi:hypothetical protein [Deinococcus marmoris]|uniref:Uncharacterized protein n=1 Tax=Deinococcus marmoris TaxID=249408 RepID=A0A1U7NYD8_9DEIO|nr:hypothetical protein [Deinococcus marmoris]OLV17936.1 hypothetical protein BOO71_0006865 [Deinococcus marmoris]